MRSFLFVLGVAGIALLPALACGGNSSGIAADDGGPPTPTPTPTPDEGDASRTDDAGTDGDASDAAASPDAAPACDVATNCPAPNTCIAGVCEAPDCGGSGTVEDPWRLCRAAHLAKLRARPGDAFLMVNDIDLGGRTFDPIPTFTGRLDGAGHAIANWTYSGGQAQGEVGFIRYLTGTLLHLSLTSVSLTATNGYYVGGLVARTSTPARIHDCHVTGKVTATQDFAWGVGGLVGYYNSGGNVTTCAAAVGGQGLLISNSSVEVDLKTTSPNASSFTGLGGILGSSGSGGVRAMIVDCYARGTFDVRGNWVGGIAGAFGGGSSGLTILRTYSTVGASRNGIVQFTNPLGGVAGSFWDTNTTGTLTSGGGGTGLGTAAMKTAATYTTAAWPTSSWVLVDGSYPALAANPVPPARTVTCADGSMAEFEGVCPIRIDRSGVVNGPDCP
jgi:hypothetical protein